MNRNAVARCLCLPTFLLGAACLVQGLAVPMVFSAPAKAADEPTGATSVNGTCTWGGTTSTWSAKLTAKGEGTYDAVYLCKWGARTLKYVGTVKTDLKTEISGSGKASGGGANGTFEFSGKYGDDGIARCRYREVGGGRGGSMTADIPRQGVEGLPGSTQPAGTGALPIEEPSRPTVHTDRVPGESAAVD